MVEGIQADSDSIVRHNPVGTREEILLWMLLNCLANYLSLSEQETPCFNGRPDASTYREAIVFVLRGRTEADFDAASYLDRLGAE